MLVQVPQASLIFCEIFYRLSRVVLSARLVVGAGLVPALRADSAPFAS